LFIVRVTVFAAFLTALFLAALRAPFLPAFTLFLDLRFVTTILDLHKWVFNKMLELARTNFSQALLVVIYPLIFY